jgi:DNA-binding NarL/FixJ family response regulator
LVDASAALAAIRTLRPDVVLLDVVLPDRSGLDVARELADYLPRPRVVLTSSRSASDLGAALDDLPVAGFVPKSDLSPNALEALLVA